MWVFCFTKSRKPILSVTDTLYLGWKCGTTGFCIKIKLLRFDSRCSGSILPSSWKWCARHVLFSITLFVIFLCSSVCDLVFCLCSASLICLSVFSYESKNWLLLLLVFFARMCELHIRIWVCACVCVLFSIIFCSIMLWNIIYDDAMFRLNCFSLIKPNSYVAHDYVYCLNGSWCCASFCRGIPGFQLWPKAVGWA